MRHIVRRLEKNRVIDGLAFTAGILLVAALYSFSVRANDKPAQVVPPPPPPVTQTQEQAQSQVTNQTVTAGGGQGGGASNQLSIGGDRSTAVALANGAQHTPQCPAGLVPGRGKNRAHGSPVYAISAVCVAPDESQAAAIDAARAHEIRLAELAIEAARAEAERDREAIRRMSTQCGVSTCVAK